MLICKTTEMQIQQIKVICVILGKSIALHEGLCHMIELAMGIVVGHVAGTKPLEANATNDPCKIWCIEAFHQIETSV